MNAGGTECWGGELSQTVRAEVRVMLHVFFSSYYLSWRKKDKSEMWSLNIEFLEEDFKIFDKALKKKKKLNTYILHFSSISCLLFLPKGSCCHSLVTVLNTFEWHTCYWLIETPRFPFSFSHECSIHYQFANWTF